MLTPPLSPGQELSPPWRVAAVQTDAGMVRLQFQDDHARTVMFRITPAGPGARRGPFDVPELSVAYQPGDVAFADLEPLGKALAGRLAELGAAGLRDWLAAAAAVPASDSAWPLRVLAGADRLELAAALDPRVVRRVALRAGPDAARQDVEALRAVLAACGIAVDLAETGRSADLATRPDDERSVPGSMATIQDHEAIRSAGDWRDSVRRHLTGQPHKSLTLGQLLPREVLPPWACALPWTRLETSQGGFVGPCCLEYQTARRPLDALPSAMWNGTGMQAFRRALAGPGQPSTCRATCPVLQGRTENPADVRLRGGPEVAIESQIRVVEALLDGREAVDAAPLAVCLTVTSYCNYDCLMCPHGVEGRLDDQLSHEFYADLQRLLPGVTVLEANGGEPLASPHFRAFLEALDGAALPQLRVNLITNGSYLGPKQLERFRTVPWGNLTFSLNAATPATYLLVNRGLAYERVREHLDALHALRASGDVRADVTYSMVILKQNVHELEAFAELAARDGATVRYMLPFRDRHGSSVMTDRTAMLHALRQLQAVAADLQTRGRGREARGVLATARVLLERLDARVLAPL